ncbi:hypothetical protein MTO96_015116 [Rhipicephalus appendiculatus]
MRETNSSNRDLDVLPHRQHRHGSSRVWFVRGVSSRATQHSKHWTCLQLAIRDADRLGRLLRGELRPEAPPKRLCAPICQGVFRDPVECPCRHVFCSACITGYMACAPSICPICDKEVTASQLVPVVPIVVDMIAKLKVKCLQRGEGCTAKVDLDCLNDHLKTCEFNRAVCESCGAEMLCSALSWHRSEQCQKRLVRCSRRCGFYVRADELPDHDCKQAIMLAVQAKRAKLCQECEEARSKVERLSLQISEIDTILTMYE